jgi:hypothetical protein
MKLSTFLLADHAEAVNGKLYVVGGAWNRIAASSFPATHNHVSVAAVIHVPWEVTNQSHTIELRLVDSDGGPVIPEPVHGSFEAGRPPGMRPGDEQLVVLVFNFEGLVFERPGTYEFHLLVNGDETGLIRFDVVPSEGVTRAG